MNKIDTALQNAEDRMISLNGQTASRERAETRLSYLSEKRDTSGLTADEISELEAIAEQLRSIAACDGDTLVKSLRGTVSNFLRSRKRRAPELMAKSLRNNQRLVVPTGKQKVTSELFIKAANAFTSGRITSQEFNVIDLHRRNRIALPDELLNKIDK